MSRTRVLLGVLITFTLALGATPPASATTSSATTSSATTAPSTAEPSASGAPSPTTDPSAAATPSPSVTPSPSASPSPTATPEIPTDSPQPGDSAPDGTPPDPTLEQMNAAGDHAMGSTIPRPAGEKATKFSSQLGVSGVLGMDVSGWQPDVNWPAQWANGARFVYIKATESTDYISSHFPGQFAGATNVGMIRGAYHFATPNTSDGATQARYFVAHGGNWAPDGRTLPPLLDIEYGYAESGGTCWGLSPAQMSWWISDFVRTMRALTGINPAIYSTANWWNTCTGSNNTFGAFPLFVARYGTSTPGALPASWLNWTMWQYASSGVFAGDQDIFNGNMTQLQQFALGAQNHPPLGNFESVSLASGKPFGVSGWSFDQTNLAAATSVQIRWNTPAGISTTTVSSNASRPDVGAAFPAAGSAHGFVASAPWSGNGQYGACVTVIALPGDAAGNAFLGCRTAFVSAVVSSAPTSRRLQDSDRFTTAVAVSKDSYPAAGVKVAYVASGQVYADALSAAPAAAAQGGPVLLSLSASVPAATMTELNRLKPAKIVVVGGTSSISDAAFAQLKTLGVPVTRLGGATRVEVSRAVADYAFPTARSVLVATGWSFPDALSAAPAAAKQRIPLLLVDGKALDSDTAVYLTDRDATSVTVAGGPASVSDTWAADTRNEGISVTRIGGASRFDVSAGIATKYFPDGGAANVYVASGIQWPDALVASAAAGKAGVPLLISSTDCVPRSIGDQVVRLRTTAMTIAGGPDTLTSSVDGLSVCY